MKSMPGSLDKPEAQAETVFGAAARNTSSASEFAAGEADNKADKVLSEQHVRSEQR